MTAAIRSVTCAAVACLPFACPAAAACRVVGDSVGVGLGQALRSCSTSARVGMSSQATAR